MMPSEQQKLELQRMFDVYRYVYNKCVERFHSDTIDRTHDSDFRKMLLRDLFVTEDTRKDDKGKTADTPFDTKISTLKAELKVTEDTQKKETIKMSIKELKRQVQVYVKKNVNSNKNPNVKSFETLVHKGIRESASSSFAAGYKSCMTNLMRGHTKHFNFDFKRKNQTKHTDCINVRQVCGSLDLKKLRFNITPTKLKKLDCDPSIPLTKSGVKALKSVGITTGKLEHDFKLLHDHSEWYLLVAFTVPSAPFVIDQISNVCGIDPGIRTFMNVFSVGKGEIQTYEYAQNRKLLESFDTRIKEFKRTNKIRREYRKVGIKETVCTGARGVTRRVTTSRIRRLAFAKTERKKRECINTLHYSVINDLLSKHNVIFYGDINSHDIVKHNKRLQKSTKRETNNLKFYQFKQRLLHKSRVSNCKVVLVKEQYTTKTCSRCGTINDNVGSNETYHCVNIDCPQQTYPRDINAAKNMLLKGYTRLFV